MNGLEQDSPATPRRPARSLAVEARITRSHHPRLFAWEHVEERYLDEVRPKLIIDQAEKALFLTSYGQGFNPDAVSRMVSKFIRKAEIGRPGSCHLVRHSCATHMLEGGADIRFIKQLKAVHARTHPAEAPKKPQDKPPGNC